MFCYKLQNEKLCCHTRRQQMHNNGMHLSLFITQGDKTDIQYSFYNNLQISSIYKESFYMIWHSSDPFLSYLYSMGLNSCQVVLLLIFMLSRRVTTDASLGRHAKFFWTQNFWAQNFFGPKVGFYSKCIAPNIFCTKNFFEPKIFLDSKYFWTQNIFGLKIFLDPNFCKPKIGRKILFWTKIFSKSKVFWTKNCEK